MAVHPYSLKFTTYYLEEILAIVASVVLLWASYTLGTTHDMHEYVAPINQVHELLPRAAAPQITPAPVSLNSMRSPSDAIPVLYQLKTDKPVVFLTIDDGEFTQPQTINFMKQHGITATLFLNNRYIKNNYGYFKKLQANGMVIENHTTNHPLLTKLSYNEQKKEICSNADIMEKVYGKRPTLFRPPYGAFNDTTRKAAADCGMKALLMWHAKADEGAMQWQDNQVLQPGDIVLMHFRPRMIEDLTAFMQAAKEAKLQVQLIENWVY